MKQTSALVFLLFFGAALCAQSDCPKGYEQIYVLCNKKEMPKCIIPAKQPECELCWEIHYDPCEGRTSGGMLSFSTYQAASSYAAADKLLYSSCPWYNNQVYRIVFNNPKDCLHKPTGNEMASSQYVREGSGDIDDLLAELLNDESVIAKDTTAKNEWEQVKKDTKETLAKEEPQKNNSGAAYSNTQTVGLRGLAGKIQSGEYDPYATKGTSANSSAGQSNASSTPGNNAGNQGSYAIFWIRNGTFTYGSPQLFVKLNGQYIMVRPGSGKVIQGARSAPPACGAQDNCDNLGWCGDFIRVNLTQTQNSWAAEEQHGGGNMAGIKQKWFGSFTAQPGCNIIEVK